MIIYKQQYFDGFYPYPKNKENLHPVDAILQQSDHIKLLKDQEFDGVTNVETILHAAGTKQQNILQRVSTFPEHRESFALDFCAIALELSFTTTKVFVVVDPASNDLYAAFLREHGGGNFTSCTQPYMHKNFIPNIVMAMHYGIKFNVYFQNAGSYIINGPKDHHFGFITGTKNSISVSCNFAYYSDPMDLCRVIKKYNVLYERIDLLRKYDKFESIPLEIRECAWCDYKTFSECLVEVRMCVMSKTNGREVNGKLDELFQSLVNPPNSSSSVSPQNLSSSVSPPNSSSLTVSPTNSSPLTMSPTNPSSHY